MWSDVFPIFSSRMSECFLIPGKHSPLWKEWRQIGKGKDSRFFMEHREAVCEAIESGVKLEQVLLSRNLWQEDKPGWEKMADATPYPWYLLEGDDLERLVSVPKLNGLCGLFSPQPSSLEALADLDFLILAWGIQDPGNVGTLLRSCGGLAGGGVILLGGCKPWSSKVARASAGSIFRTPLATFALQEGEGILEDLRARGFKAYSTAPRHGSPLRKVEWSGKDIVILGNESHGLPRRVEECSELITLEMTSATESLNVATTGSIICYEWKKRCLEAGLHG